MSLKFLKKYLGEDGIASPSSGEAPSYVSMNSVITEPVNDPSPNNAPLAGSTHDLYSLYPDLVNIDVTSACNLAEYFNELCQVEQQNLQMQQQQMMVPSAAQVGTPNEF